MGAHKNGAKLKILELIGEGRFAVLGEDPTRDRVRLALGPPDDTGVGKQQSRLWRYGPVEFHFGEDGALQLVHADNFAFSSPILDMWIIDSRPSVERLTAALSLEGIETGGSKDLGFRTSSGVEFVFRDSGELHSVSLHVNKESKSHRQISVRLTDADYTKVRLRAEKSGSSMSHVLSKLIQDEIQNW